MRDQIAQLLTDESLRRICAREGMPDRGTVERWMSEDAEFAAKCARAREAHADRIFDGLEEVEDDLLVGKVDPQSARVVIASRQWRAEKLKPKKYGQKLDVEHGGAVNHSVKVTFG